MHLHSRILMSAAFVVLLVGWWPAATMAFDPYRHAMAAYDAAIKMGVPRSVARIIAIGATAPDLYEFNNPAAHAQPDIRIKEFKDGSTGLVSGKRDTPIKPQDYDQIEGQARTNSKQWHDYHFNLAVTAAKQGKFEQAAFLLGYASHNLGDEVAHGYMPNAPHAALDSIDLSPDVDNKKLGRDAYPAIRADFERFRKEIGEDNWTRLGQLPPTVLSSWNPSNANADWDPSKNGAEEWDPSKPYLTSAEENRREWDRKVGFLAGVATLDSVVRPLLDTSGLTGRAKTPLPDRLSISGFNKSRKEYSEQGDLFWRLSAKDQQILIKRFSPDVRARIEKTAADKRGVHTNQSVSTVRATEPSMLPSRSSMPGVKPNSDYKGVWPADVGSDQKLDLRPSGTCFFGVGGGCAGQSPQLEQGGAEINKPPQQLANQGYHATDVGGRGQSGNAQAPGAVIGAPGKSLAPTGTGISSGAPGGRTTSGPPSAGALLHGARSLNESNIGSGAASGSRGGPMGTYNAASAPTGVSGPMEPTPIRGGGGIPITGAGITSGSPKGVPSTAARPGGISLTKAAADRMPLNITLDGSYYSDGRIVLMGKQDPAHSIDAALFLTSLRLACTSTDPYFSLDPIQGPAWNKEGEEASAAFWKRIEANFKKQPNIRQKSSNFSIRTISARRDYSQIWSSMEGSYPNLKSQLVFRPTWLQETRFGEILYKADVLLKELSGGGSSNRTRSFEGFQGRKIRPGKCAICSTGVACVI
jgi:hypothetical protein